MKTNNLALRLSPTRRPGRGLTLGVLLLIQSAWAGPVTTSYTYDAAGRLIAADYGAGNKVDYSHTVAGSLVRKTLRSGTNAAPAPQLDIFSSAFDANLDILVAGLLQNDGDPDRDPLSLAGLFPHSAAGGSVSLAGATLTYVPVAGFVGQDAIFLVVADDQGGSTLADVLVNVETSSTAVYEVTERGLLNDGSVQIDLGGPPSQVYRVEVSTDLFRWDHLGDFTADASGAVQILDAGALQFFVPRRFYRVVALP